MKKNCLFTMAAVSVLLFGGCISSAPNDEKDALNPDNVYESSEHLVCNNKTIRLAKVSKNLLEDNFAAPSSIWEDFINFEKRITFTYGERLGTKGLVLTTNIGGDTAFELRTKPFTVNPGSDFVFRIGARGSIDLSRARGHQELYHTQIVWLDAKGKQVDVQPFSYETAPEKVIFTTITGQVPDKAEKAVIRFGADSPNITRGNYVTYTHISFQSTEKDSQQWPTGYFISRPFLTPDKGKIIWDADVPAGTSLAVQLATAPDDNGIPGVWTPFGGEELNPAKAFLKSGAKLPPFPNNHPWMRYKVTFNGTNLKSPVLKSIRIGEIFDNNWLGEDTTPPVIQKQFPTISENASLPVVFSVTDQTRVEWRTLELLMDGKDITSQVKRSSNTVTYTPQTPIAPVTPQFTDFNDWDIQNLAKRLTITTTRENVPGLFVSRDDEELDTMFSATSPMQSIQAGAEYKFTVEIRHNLPISKSGAAQHAPLKILWFDKNGKPVGEPAFLYTPDCLMWTPFTLTAKAPEGAERAQAFIRLDTPNIANKKYYQCKNPKWEGPVGTALKKTPNLHLFNLKISDAAGNEITGSYSLLIDKPLTRNVVTLRDDGFVLVDGTPFFPIGIYAVCKREFNGNNLDKAVYDLKEAGFNLIHTYGSRRDTNFKELVAAAEKYGMKMYVASRHGANSLNEEDYLKDIANEYRSPAAFAWYLADDTSGYVSPEKLRRLHSILRELDPYHITVQADGVGTPENSHYHDYVHSTDGYLPEIYPVRKSLPNEQSVPKVIQDMKVIQADLAAAGNPVKTIWPIIQYFEGWSGWDRFPTFAQLRAMSYLAIIHGGHGITWYTYGGFDKNHGITHTPEIWNNMKTVATELNALSEVFLTHSNGKTIAAQIQGKVKLDALGFDAISVLYKQLGNKSFLICANSSEATITAKFDTKEAGISPDVAKVWFEDRTIKLQKGVFEDTFEPNGVHVYELKGLFD
ncbi:MAG: hypothetical protein IKP00_15365 [Victivallales bacterium]|nr:hypothetical protein [Victivallales bacterium]